MENQTSYALDGGYGWVVVTVSLLIHTIGFGTINSFGVFLPKLVDHFDEGKGTVAWIGSLLAGVNLGIGPLASVLINTYGCRATCVAGSVFAMIAISLSTLSNSLVVLTITYGIFGGIGLGVMYLPAVVCVGQYFDKKRSLAIGITVCGTGLGSFVMAPFAAMLLDNYDWRGSILIMSAVIFNGAVLGSLMRPLTPKKQSQSGMNKDSEVDLPAKSSHQPNQNTEMQIKGTETCKPKSSPLINLSLVKNPVFFFFTTAFVCGDLGLYVPFMYIIDVAMTKAIGDHETVSYLVSTIGITNMIGRIFSGYMASFPSVKPLSMMYVCTAVCSVAVVAIPFCYSYLQFSVVAVSFGLFSASFNALVSIVLVELLGISQLTDAFGLLGLADGVAVIIGPPLAGWIYDVTNNYEGPFMFAGALVFTSSFLFFLVSYVRDFLENRKEKANKLKKILSRIKFIEA